MGAQAGRVGGWDGHWVILTPGGAGQFAQESVAVIHLGHDVHLTVRVHHYSLGVRLVPAVSQRDRDSVTG